MAHCSERFTPSQRTPARALPLLLLTSSRLSGATFVEFPGRARAESRHGAVPNSLEVQKSTTTRHTAVAAVIDQGGDDDLDVGGVRQRRRVRWLARASRKCRSALAPRFCALLDRPRRRRVFWPPPPPLLLRRAAVGERASGRSLIFPAGALRRAPVFIDLLLLPAPDPGVASVAPGPLRHARTKRIAAQRLT